MKIKEALEKRIPRVRKEIWANPECYLCLPLLPNGMVGPWAELYDERMLTDGVNADIACTKLLVFIVEEDEDFEVYTGKVSRLEQENYARVYTEG